MIDTILNLGHHPLVMRLGWALLHLVWQAPLVAAGLAVALCLLRQASSRYLAGCLALAALAALPVATWIDLGETTATQATLGGGLGAPTSGSAVTPSAIPLPDAASGPVYRPGDTSGTYVTHAALGRRRLAQLMELLLPGLTLCWVAGVVLMAVRLITGWFEVQRIRYLASEPPGPPWQDRLPVLAKRMNIWRSVRLLQSGQVAGPVQIGWLRPVVLVPVSMLTQLTVQELEALLTHELAHIRRHDYLVNLLQSVVEIFFYMLQVRQRP